MPSSLKVLPVYRRLGSNKEKFPAQRIASIVFHIQIFLFLR